MVKILLLGSGAREHCIAEALKRSASDVELFSYMKSRNPGIAKLASDVEIGADDDVNKIKAFATKVQPDFAFVGPDDMLGYGVVDALLEVGIKSVGPTKTLARLETSKSFTRDLMKKHGVPGNPRFGSFTRETIHEMALFVDQLDEIVVKPDGLTGGKGVRVQGDHFETKRDGVTYAIEVLESHKAVVIEEKLVGEEFSLMCFTDGRTVVPMPAVQDHKRALEGDRGPNTGGMGSYSDANHRLPFLSDEDYDAAVEITQKVVLALGEEIGEFYKGIVYGGFIAVKDGVRVIEYNARFGDPEVMNLLTTLKSDFVSICQAMIDGTLEDAEVVFDEKATVCKYIVPAGYPDEPLEGEKVEVGDVPSDAYLFYGSVNEKDDGVYMTRSRAIGVVGVGDSLGEAESLAEQAVGSVSGKTFHRSDIGTGALVNKRVYHLNQLRGT